MNTFKPAMAWFQIEKELEMLSKNDEPKYSVDAPPEFRAFISAAKAVLRAYEVAKTELK